MLIYALCICNDIAIYRVTEVLGADRKSRLIIYLEKEYALCDQAVVWCVVQS